MVSSLVSSAPVDAAGPMKFSLCTSETPFPPLSSGYAERPGRSQVLIHMVAKKLGVEIHNSYTPWKRCQIILESGGFDAMSLTGYAGINRTIAVFPMQYGLPDKAKSLGSVPSVLYRRVGDKADFIGGRLVNTGKAVAVLVARQVNKDAVDRAGGTSEDGAKTVAALAQKLVSGQADLAASAEIEFADLVAAQYKGVLEALPIPLVESNYYVVFSRQYYSAHQAEVEKFWSQMAITRESREYIQAIETLK